MGLGKWDKEAGKQRDQKSQGSSPKSTPSCRCMCSTRGALGPPWLPSAQSCILSVEHVLRPGCSFLFFYFIYNAPRKTKPKDVLQFIFLRSPHKPKSKDFLQLILLIFYFEYPLKTWRNPFLATDFLLCTSSSRSYFTSWRPTNCLSVHLSNHQNLFFQVKITLFYQTFFQRNVISQLLSQTRCITSLYYHKKHLINNFGFLICRRGFTCWWLFRWGCLFSP